jgi:hypothetical protein
MIRLEKEHQIQYRKRGEREWLSLQPYSDWTPHETLREMVDRFRGRATVPHDSFFDHEVRIVTIRRLVLEWPWRS